MKIKKELIVLILLWVMWAMIFIGGMISMVSCAGVNKELEQELLMEVERGRV